ncbi:MAG: hypothetical protein N2169_00850 [bacterium]|nr:hypothetical protein [bacterium]
MMKKGNVLLLSLFLLAFTVSIIGLIYSYNKRILLISKQERDNYQKTNMLIREAFLNIYILDKFRNGFTIEGLNIHSFSSHIGSVSILGVSIPFNWTGNWEQTTSIITPTGLTIDETQVVLQSNIDGSMSTGSQDISSYVNAIKSDRYNYFGQKRALIKSTLEEYISNLYQGFEKQIELIHEGLPGIDENNSAGTYILEYQVTINQTKKGKKKINRKFIVRAEYNVSVSFEMKCSISGSSETITQSGIADTRTIYDPELGYITENKYYFNKTINFTINTSNFTRIELKKLEIKQI